MHRARISILTFLTACGLGAAESAHAGGAEGAIPWGHYHYFKQKRELPLDATRIAVRKMAASGGGVNDALRRSGLAEAAATDLAIEGWSTVALPGDSRNVERVKQLVTELAGDPALDFASPVFVGSDGGPVIVTRDLLIGFADGVSDERAAAILSAAGTIVDKHWTGMHGVYRVRSNLRSGIMVLSVANDLAARAEVSFAEPDMIFTGRSELIPNDPFFASCWGLHNTGQSGGTVNMDMDGPEAWEVTTGSPSIITVIIDTGVQQNHPDINQIPGNDVTGQAGGGGPVNPCDVHGTAVAGCVSAKINNWIGVVGIAPGTKTASVRTFVSNQPCNGTWSSSASLTVAALAWAESIGARVTNNSNYYGFQSGTISTKYAQTRANGMVHFASAGNDASSIISYPASIPEVNSVAALTRNGFLAGFSNFGVGLDFSAPGQDIATTDRTGLDGYASGDYATVNGTSFASPYSAGVAALVLSARPTLPAADVEQIMQLSCRDLGTSGYDTTYGWGFVNARAALFAAGDCNGNGVPDEDDIALGTSVDCNDSGVPDECEVPPRCLTCPDCQGDQIPDDCQVPPICPACIDCQGDGVPDTCQVPPLCPNCLDCQGDTVPDVCQVPPLCPGCADCNVNGVPDTCETDCNSNGEPDNCDIVTGFSQDCAPDNVPDECQVPPRCPLCPDCDQNGVPDFCDAAVADCNADLIPDHCQTHPALCGGSCLTDCDQNFVPDSCQLIGAFSAQSPELAPIHGTSPQNFVLIAPPIATGDVTLEVQAVADLGSLSENIVIKLNGIAVGTLFSVSFDCALDVESLVVPAATFNGIVNGGNAIIEMAPSLSVDAPSCPTSHISVRVDYAIASGDCNNNSILDTCEVAAGTSPDCNANGVPDSCDLAAGSLTDSDSNGIADACECVFISCAGDLTLEATVNGDDVQYFLGCLVGGDLASYPCACADINGDLRLNAADIPAFVNRLILDPETNCH